jgi:Tol biopolymer transport system component
VRQITTDVHKDRVPRWSPKGDLILFYSDRTSKSYEAWTIRPDGSGIQQISAAHGVPLFDPIWSPDGRRVLYSLENRVEIIDAALPPGRQSPRRLPAPAGGKAGSKPEPFLPTAWSPDGDHLLGAILGTTRETEIALFSFATGRYQILPARGSGAVWLDTVRAVYLHDGGLYLLDTRTGASRKLGAPPERSAYRVVAVAQDGRNLYVVREINEGDIKMLEMQ